MLLKIYSVKPQFILYFTLFLGLFSATGIKTPAIQIRTDFSQPIVKCWELNNPNFESLASDNDLLLTLSNDGSISNIDLKEPIELWKISIGSKNNIFIRIIDNRIFIISGEIDKDEKRLTSIREIDGQSGLLKKIEEYKDSSILNTDQLLFDRNSPRLLLQINRKSDTKPEIAAIDITSLQGFHSDGKISGYNLLTAHTDISFFIVDKNTIFENALKDHSRKRSISVGNENITAIQAIKKDLILGDQKGGLYILSQKSSAPQKILRTGGKISSIQIIDNNVLIVSDDNFLYLYSPENKRIIWKKRMPGRINVSPVAFSKFLFVTTTVEPNVYLINTEDGKQLNQISVGNNVFIKDMRVNKSGIFILTSVGLSKYSESCDK